MNATILALLASIASLTSETSVIAKIIKQLIQTLPVIVQEYQDLKAPVMNIINALSANPATTDEQMATLQQLDTTTDQAFDDSVAAYLANHPAPAGSTA